VAFIPWPNGVQLCFDFTTASQQWQFCLALRKSAGAPTDVDLGLVAAEAVDWWTDHFKSGVCSGTVLRQIRVTDMTAEGAPQHIATVNENGTDATAPIILGTAAVVSQRTEKRGRSFRGRAYLGGLPADSGSTAVDMTTVYAAGQAAAFGLLQTALDAIGFDMVVASTRHNGSTRATAELNETIAFIVDTHYDSQRRRLAGRGT